MTRHSFRFRIKAHVSLPFMTCDLRIHTCVVKCQRADCNLRVSFSLSNNLWVV